MGNPLIKRFSLSSRGAKLASWRALAWGNRAAAACLLRAKGVFKAAHLAALGLILALCALSLLANASGALSAAPAWALAWIPWGGGFEADGWMDFKVCALGGGAVLALSCLVAIGSALKKALIGALSRSELKARELAREALARREALEISQSAGRSRASQKRPRL